MQDQSGILQLIIRRIFILDRLTETKTPTTFTVLAITAHSTWAIFAFDFLIALTSPSLAIELGCTAHSGVPHHMCSTFMPASTFSRSRISCSSASLRTTPTYSKPTGAGRGGQHSTAEQLIRGRGGTWQRRRPSCAARPIAQSNEASPAAHVSTNIRV